MSNDDLVQRALELLRQPIKTVKTPETLKPPPAFDPIPTVHPGDRIEWTRAAGAQQGTVDMIHVDDTGAHWAFVTLEESWAAVNMKFVKESAR